MLHVMMYKQVCSSGPVVVQHVSRVHPRRVAACCASLLQESKEALERLRRMGAYEAQDFDVTVSLASATRDGCPRGCASAYRPALDEPGFILPYMSLSRLAETAKSFCSHVQSQLMLLPIFSSWIYADAPAGE